MRRGVKVVVWIVVFAVCAGAGAYVAAHTNPFPPGVEDPGARSTSSAASPSASRPRWTGTMRSRTEHVLHVGGGCSTDWITTLSFRIDGDGKAHGAGTSRLLGDPRCDFPVAQVQTTAARVRVTGTTQGVTLHLRLVRQGPLDPVGSHDLGGFIETLVLMHPVIEVAAPPGRWYFAARRPDGDLGFYRSRNVLAARCVKGC